MMQAKEWNFDGLVGPTHNYAGLSRGNLASTRNAGSASNPRLAALQGLDKMAALARAGFPQALLPPLARPCFRVLRAAGFTGGDAQMISAAARAEPWLLAAAYSASSMWVANAATVSPSADTADGRVHFTPANLQSKLHRALEAEDTGHALRTLFADEDRFAVHAPLPAVGAFADEGAANHTRLCASHGVPGLAFFVYGRSESAPAREAARFPARQTLEASRAVARGHGLSPDAVVFSRQRPAAIDAGVFHNDVIAVGTLDSLLYHEDAFDDEQGTIAALRAGARMRGFELKAWRIGREMLGLEDAVATYLFNSQLLARPDGRLSLVLPAECSDHAGARAVVESLRAEGAIAEALHFDLRQSMRNGGGPACLRLRVVLDEAQRAAVRGRVFVDDALHAELAGWVRRRYRDRLVPEDLADPQLAVEVDEALRELEGILRLPGLYPKLSGTA